VLSANPGENSAQFLTALGQLSTGNVQHSALSKIQEHCPLFASLHSAPSQLFLTPQWFNCKSHLSWMVFSIDYKRPNVVLLYVIIFDNIVTSLFSHESLLKFWLQMSEIQILVPSASKDGILKKECNSKQKGKRLCRPVSKGGVIIAAVFKEAVTPIGVHGCIIMKIQDIK
jgi:hypothetical protein